MFDLMLYLPIAGTEINALSLVLLGFTVGVIGGFFGVGGAFMVTPALNVFGFPMAYAIGTDMAHIAGKSIVSTVKHRKLGNVDIKLGILMIAGTAIGIELGSHLIMWLESIGRIGPVVRLLYIVLLFSLGSYMIFEYIKHSRGHEGLKGKDIGASSLALRMQGINIRPMIYLRTSGFSISLWVILGLSAITGFIAGLLGVGGGFIRMPALMYVIGTSTKIAVGTDLFEVMFSGMYGAFTYALKGRVELIAAIVMLGGAAIGAQIGTLATKYVKGLIIRLYFAITMLLAGISVVLKHIAEQNKVIYEPSLNEWAKNTSGLIDSSEIRNWLYMNKPAIAEWLAGQPEIITAAYITEKSWNSYSGCLMLGASCALSAVIIFFLVRGVLREKAELSLAEPIPSGVKKQVVIASRCFPSDMPAIRLGARVARDMADEAVLVTCMEEGVCEDCISEGIKLLSLHGIKPRLEFIEEGKPYKEILKLASGAHLLVIGSKPLSPLHTGYYLGDNATRIVRNMTTSTLVVKGREELKKILLCIHLPYSGKTVDMARAIAIANDSMVELLYVISLPTMYSRDLPEPEIALDSAEASVYIKELELLNTVKADLLSTGVKDVSVKLSEGIVEEQILAESVEGNFDLIIINEGIFKTPFGLFSGRLSTSLVTHSQSASVLIVKS